MPQDGLDLTPLTPQESPTSSSTPAESGLDLSLDHEATLQNKYGSLGQQAIAGVEGAAKGLAGPLATYAEKELLDVPPEESEARAEANPVTHLLGEATGLIGPAVAAKFIPAIATLAEVTQAGLLGKAGSAASKAVGFEGALATATKLGVENALFTLGDEASKAINEHPDTIQNAAMKVGLSGMLGAGVGYGLGKVGELWKAKVGPEADKFVSDFQGRLNAHGNGQMPAVDAVHSELTNEFQNVNNAMDELRGASGLKAQDIAKLLPQESTPKMFGEANRVLTETEELIAKAKAESGIYQGGRFKAVEEYGNRLATSMADPNVTPQQMFTAIDQFKKDVGQLVKWNVFTPDVEKPGVTLVKELYDSVKVGLEDSSVWGGAAKRQQAINKLFTEFIPAQKDFVKTFAEKVGDELQISPNKVNILINGLGKPNSELKIDRLQNYLNATDKLYGELDKVHANLGVENPFTRSSMTSTRAMMQEITPGMKAADFVHSSAINALAESLAGVSGAIAGQATGLPGGGIAGYLFGKSAVKPILKTILPTIIAPLLRNAPSGEALKAAVDGITAVVAGETLASSSAKALFESGSRTALQALVPDKARIEKLAKSIEMSKNNPNGLLDVGGKMGHYMGASQTAMAQTVQTAIEYLDSQKPLTTKRAPMDRETPPSPGAQAQYNRSLQIAEQPLSVLSRLHQGTLTQKDVTDLKILYPEVYKNITQKVNAELIDHMSKGTVVPVTIRRGLSILTGEPVDSSFTQPSILAAQMTFQPPQRPQNKPPTGKNSPKLNKASDAYETPVEARIRALKK